MGGGRGCEVWAEGWVEREGKGFSSLMKQKKKAKNYAVFCFAGKRNFFFYIYDVITWEKKEKNPGLNYSRSAKRGPHPPAGFRCASASGCAEQNLQLQATLR